MNILNISLEQIQVYFLIFIRVSAIMMSAPLFDSKTIPVIFKAGLAIAISIVLVPVLNLNNIVFVEEIIPFGIGLAGEIILGIIIGLSVKLVFAGIQLAGKLTGLQMGFAIADILDPITSSQVSITGQFNFLVAMLIFLIINAHHWFLIALAESFQLIPPFNFNFTTAIIEQIMILAGNLFVIAVKVGAPVIAALLITSVTMGLIARTVPQMQIFIVAMPLKIIVGLLFLGLSLPYLSALLQQIYYDLGRDIFRILNAI